MPPVQIKADSHMAGPTKVKPCGETLRFFATQRCLHHRNNVLKITEVWGP